MTGVHGPFVEARRLELRAGLAALDGRVADALAFYADSLRRFRDLGIEVDQAFATIEMATLLNPTLPEVVAAGAAAREILVRLGAAPFIARLDAALARSAEGGENGASAPARKARNAPLKAG